MGRRTLILIGIGAGLLVAALILLPFAQSAAWVSHRDLFVRFIVVDQAGRPVPGASISVEQAAFSLCERLEADSFILKCDSDGEVARRIKRCMTFGRRGSFENPYHSHVPRWRFAASADGYKSSETRLLEEPEFRKDLRRGSDASELSARIELSPKEDVSAAEPRRRS